MMNNKHNKYNSHDFKVVGQLNTVYDYKKMIEAANDPYYGQNVINTEKMESNSKAKVLSRRKYKRQY